MHHYFEMRTAQIAQSQQGELPSPPSLALPVALPALSSPQDLETWHRRLGHANPRTVLDMARGDAVIGMTTNLSLVPPTCDACIRSKQARSPIPKQREGAKSSRRLERIHIDLSGPHSVPSCSGFTYIKSIIDDFSGYHWTRLLKMKSDAFRAVRGWLPAAETQSGERLRYLITDNGELRSAEMASWCAERGITHLFTTPYTPLQNVKVERLHRTLMNKARSMRLAYSAPLQMWDEFVLTASFLSNLTITKSLNNKTPHELWFSAKLGLSRLREIGCKAYALITNNNPEIAARSIECVLIGYTPNSKAYRCWYREGARIFDSYHVTFIERLNLMPQPSTLSETLPPFNPMNGPSPSSPISTTNATPPPAPSTSLRRSTRPSDIFP